MHSIFAEVGFHGIRIKRLAPKVKLGADVVTAANGALDNGALLRAAAEIGEPRQETFLVRLRA